MKRRRTTAGTIGIAVATIVVLGGAVLAANAFITRDSAELYQARSLTSGLSDQMDLAQTASFDIDNNYQVPPPAATKLEAVETFVAAEIQGDYDTAYGLLSADDRAVYGSPEGWQVAHQNVPNITDSDPALLGTETVVTRVRFEPLLDRRVGSIPARGDIRWETVTEDGGFRVAYAASSLVPEYPDPVSAPAAVQRWAETVQTCEPAGALELEGGVLGVTGFVDRLCGSEGPVSLGDTNRLASLDDPAVFLNAFGPAAADYIEVVELSEPVAMRVVTAPLGDEWRVVGLARP